MKLRKIPVEQMTPEERAELGRAERQRLQREKQDMRRYGRVLTPQERAENQKRLYGRLASPKAVWIQVVQGGAMESARRRH